MTYYRQLDIRRAFVDPRRARMVALIEQDQRLRLDRWVGRLGVLAVVALVGLVVGLPWLR